MFLCLSAVAGLVMGIVSSECGDSESWEYAVLAVFIGLGEV